MFPKMLIQNQYDVKKEEFRNLELAKLFYYKKTLAATSVDH